MSRESFGKLYMKYCDEIPDREPTYLRRLFDVRFRNKPVLWYGKVEEKSDERIIFVMKSLFPGNEPRVLLKLPQSLEDPQNFVIGQCSHFKGTLKGFSNLICQDPQDPEFSAILELNTDATFTSNPFDLDLTFMQFEEYFGTFDQSPFQDKYEKYWKDTPIDVIGRFKEGSLADGQFRIYQFVIERPSRPSNDFGFWRGTIRVRVAITQSGDIQRFIAENERLEIVVVPYARNGSPHVFNLNEIVGPRIQTPTSVRLAF